MTTDGRVSNTRALIWPLAIGAFLYTTVTWFPGVANFDSNFQYQEALTGRYTDWHPPIMAHLWALLALLAAGNAPLFLLHLFIYWLGFALTAVALVKLGLTRAAWAALIVGALPVFFMLNVQLVKDVGMSVSLLTSFAILFSYRSRQARVPVLAGALVSLLLVYAVLVRVNGVFAAAPLILYFYDPTIRFRPLRFCSLYVLAVVLLIPGATLVNQKLFDAIPTHPVRSLEVFDLTGIAYFSKDVSVLGAGAGLPWEAVHRCYSPRTWDALSPKAKCEVFWQTLATLDVPAVPDAQATATTGHQSWYEDSSNPALVRLWRAAVLKHPLAYLEHRLAHYNSALYFWVQRHHADRAVLDKISFGEPLPDHRPVNRLLDLLAFNWLFTPVAALALGLALLNTVVGKKTMNSPIRDATFFLALSGVAYSAGFFVVGVSSDLRYQFWPMLAIFTAAALCVPERWNRHRVPRAAWTGAALVVLTLLVTWISRLVLGDAFNS